MSKFHSTVSRRDFMKAIGIGAAGLGAAAATAPVFHDMDEVVAAPTSLQPKPWFVQEVDKPTIEIDFNLREPEFPYYNSVLGGGRDWGGGVKALDEIYGEGYYNEKRADKLERYDQLLKANTPGYTLKDVALGDGIRSFDELNFSPMEGFRKKKTPEQRGVPKWTGTPEEANRIMKTMVRAAGGSQVGVIDMEDKSMGDPYKLLYKDRVPFVEEGLEDHYYDTDGKIHIPKFRWMIYYQPQNSRTLKLDNPFHSLGMAGGQAARDVLMGSYIQNCIWGLGYQTYGNGLAPGPPTAILAGVDEYCRLHNGVSYELGTMIGGNQLLTNMPLAPTKPMDMGVVTWCKICRKCTDICPGGAISDEKELTWERSTGPWNAPNDHTGWTNHSLKCYWDVWRTQLPHGQCVLCSATCPFSKEFTSWIHEGSKFLVAQNLEWLDSTLLNLDDFFGYGNYDNMMDPKTLAGWWEYDHAPHIQDVGQIVRDY